MNTAPLSFQLVTKTNLLISFLLFTLFVSAQKTFNATTGNWNVAANWSPSGVPASTDDIIIPTGKTVTVTADTSAKNISIQGTLTVNDKITLTIYGNVDVSNGGQFNAGTGNNDSTTIKVYGNFTNNGAANFWKSNVVIGGNLATASTILQNNGNIVVGGNVTGSVTGSGSGTIYPVNSNATTSMTGGATVKASGTSPTDSTLLSLMNEVIYNNNGSSNCSFSITDPSNSTLCAGATATFSVTTSPGSTFQWQVNTGTGWINVGTSSTLTLIGVTIGMNGNMYRVLITNGSCTKNSDFAYLYINATPDAPTFGTITQPTCSNSTGSFKITNYNNSYIYSYSADLSRSSDTFSGSVGSYTIKATSNSCTSVSSANIIINSQPITPALPATSVTQPNCTVVTGSITVTTQNSGEAYSFDNGANFQTSNTKTGLTSGDYKIIIKSSGGCNSNTTTTTINTQPTTLTQPVVTTTQPTCAVLSGSINITSPIGSGITYSIDNSNYSNTTGIFTLLNPGTYNVTAKNASGCISTSNKITISSTTGKTWTGTADNNWSNPANWNPVGVPTAEDCVIVNNSPNSILITGNVYTYNINISANSKLEVASSGTLTVTNEINVNSTGTFLLQDSAGLIQINNVTNTGNITVNRNTTPTMLNDYTYWSSPTTGTQTLLSFSPNSIPKYFLGYENKWIYLNAKTTTFDKGIGYAILAPKSSSTTTANILNYQFTGTPNNGNISVPVTLGTGSFSSKLIGNPYPSAISADDFILANIKDSNNPNKNQSISGTIYYWTHNHGTTNGNYTASDYATYNLTGGTSVNNGHANTKAPKFYIASGQGFIVETKANGNVAFTNNMRVGIADKADNSNFYRTSSEVSNSHQLEKHRIWLNLSDNNTNFSQILLGYIENATNDYDPGFDGAYNNNDKFALYSLIGNGIYTIQGKSLPFTDTDIIPLGFKAAASGNVTISIDNVDGLFAEGQNIYVEDKLTNTTHDLSTASYTFTSEAGTFNDRFVIKYKDDSTTLGVDTFDGNQNNLSITSINHVIDVKCDTDNIQKVFVYDILGKQIFENNNVNSFETSIANLPNNQVYIVKAILASGKFYNKKVIN